MKVLSLFDGAACGLQALKQAGGYSEKKISTDNITWRKLTPIECERLQTLPDNYTEGVSNTQRYKILGNGWTVAVIQHIFENLYKPF